MRGRGLGSLALAALVALPASAQTLDEVLARYVAARGGLEKLRAVKTLRMSGTMTVGPGAEAPFTLEMKRPNLRRLEFTLQGTMGVQAFDGKTAWMILPFPEAREPQVLSPEEAREAEEDSDIDGPLVDYRAKGHQVELVGKEKLAEGEAWKLKLTLKSGTVRHVFLDATSFLEVRGETRRSVRGRDLEGEAVFGDYKEVAGLVFPHTIEAGPKGSARKQKLVFDKIEVNVPLDDARFRMPEGGGSESKEPETPRP